MAPENFSQVVLTNATNKDYFKIHFTTWEGLAK